MGSMGGVNVVKPPDIIIIEDDNEGVLESDDQVEFCDTDFDSDAGSRKVPGLFKASVSLQSCDDLSSTSSELSSSSDEEECLVVEPGPSIAPRHRQKLFYRARKRPVKRRRRTLSSSSDCEIIEDLCGKGRQDWEEAALRKRMGGVNNTSRFRAESEGSTSASNIASSAGKENLVKKEKDHVEENGAKVEKQGKTSQFTSVNPVPPVSCVFSKEREDTLVDQQDSNDDLVDEGVEVTEASIREVTPLEGVACNSSGNDVESAGGAVDTAVVGNADDSLPESLSPLEGCEDSSLSKEVDERIPKDKAPEGVGFTCSEIGRERLKETDEFRHADEEEWARRQLELKRQAQEAQRERKRRRLEAERRMEMENRQRRRLEEIRQSQMEEEQNLGYKELVRGRVRSELERVAASCKDMATLLRRLGIPVDGGSFPTAQHVNAAYKKALLRFHPDRVAGMAKSDPLQQVEAEETFKLISRMKGTLEPVALRIFP